MKKELILSAVLSVVALMLVSCAGEPEATTTTTRQTTVTTAAPPPAARTTTTTTHVGSTGYWLPKPSGFGSLVDVGLSGLSSHRRTDDVW